MEWPSFVILKGQTFWPRRKRFLINFWDSILHRVFRLEPLPSGKNPFFEYLCFFKGIQDKGEIIFLRTDPKNQTPEYFSSPERDFAYFFLSFFIERGAMVPFCFCGIPFQLIKRGEIIRFLLPPQRLVPFSFLDHQSHPPPSFVMPALFPTPAEKIFSGRLGAHGRGALPSLLESKPVSFRGGHLSAVLFVDSSEEELSFSSRF